MVELKLEGIHDDGEHLVLIDGSNHRFRVAITEELRAAVRRDRPQLEQLRSHDVRPRDIQAMIRAGASAQTVAQEAGIPLESIRRYEGPVIAERQYTAQRAQGLHVARTPDAPTLGDLVVDRLAARHVSDIEWDAYRPDGGSWHVTAAYTAGLQEFLATWEVDLTAGTFTALDDEARWLSEVDLADSPYRHLTPVEDRFYDVESDGGLPAEGEPGEIDESGSTDAILEELEAARGVRQPLEAEVLEEPTLWDDPPAAHPALSRPQDATDATVLQLPQPEPAAVQGEEEEQPVQEEEPKPTRKRSRQRRTSVPSWDEIVFGAKND